MACSASSYFALSKQQASVSHSHLLVCLVQGRAGCLLRGAGVCVCVCVCVF